MRVYACGSLKIHLGTVVEVSRVCVCVAVFACYFRFSSTILMLNTHLTKFHASSCQKSEFDKPCKP